MRTLENQPARIEGATLALRIMGGYASAARKISEATGKTITAARVEKWKDNGIAPGFHPVVHDITKLPLWLLDPDIYPERLFKAE
ncbi:MAG: hypothetical protein E4H01_16895 [Lysobacterales bacterium]|nr:MAG: hypothetical protein E4H01_16895 [Xanthomonadales bacterium]